MRLMLASVEKRSHLVHDVPGGPRTEGPRQSCANLWTENPAVEDHDGRHVLLPTNAPTRALHCPVKGGVKIGVLVPPTPAEALGVEGAQGLSPEVGRTHGQARHNHPLQQVAGVVDSFGEGAALHRHQEAPTCLSPRSQDVNESLLRRFRLTPVLPDHPLLQGEGPEGLPDPASDLIRGKERGHITRDHTTQAGNLSRAGAERTWPFPVGQGESSAREEEPVLGRKIGQVLPNSRATRLQAEKVHVHLPRVQGPAHQEDGVEAPEDLLGGGLGVQGGEEKGASISPGDKPKITFLVPALEDGLGLLDSHPVLPMPRNETVEVPNQGTTRGPRPGEHRTPFQESVEELRGDPGIPAHEPGLAREEARHGGQRGGASLRSGRPGKAGKGLGGEAVREDLPGAGREVVCLIHDADEVTPTEARGSQDAVRGRVEEMIVIAHDQLGSADGPKGGAVGTDPKAEGETDGVLGVKRLPKEGPSKGSNRALLAKMGFRVGTHRLPGHQIHGRDGVSVATDQARGFHGDPMLAPPSRGEDDLLLLLPGHLQARGQGHRGLSQAGGRLREKNALPSEPLPRVSQEEGLSLPRGVIGKQTLDHDPRATRGVVWVPAAGRVPFAVPGETPALEGQAKSGQIL